VGHGGEDKTPPGKKEGGYQLPSFRRTRFGTEGGRSRRLLTMRGEKWGKKEELRPNLSVGEERISNVPSGGRKRGWAENRPLDYSTAEKPITSRKSHGKRATADFVRQALLPTPTRGGCQVACTLRRKIQEEGGRPKLKTTAGS